LPAVADAAHPETLPWEAPVFAEPPASRDDVLHVAAAQVAVAQPTPRPPGSRPTAVVGGEDREPLRDRELEPRPPFVHGLRLGAPMRIDDRGMAAAPLPRLEEPRGNLATIEAPVPDQFAVHELGGWQLPLQAVDERGRPPASSKEETVRLRERRMVVEESGTIGMPRGVACGASCGGDAPDAAPVAGNGLQLDVPIVVLEVRDPLSVRRPLRYRLVPSALGGPPYAACLQVDDADVQLVVEIRDEHELTPVRGPWFRTSRFAADPTFRVRGRHEF